MLGTACGKTPQRIVIQLYHPGGIFRQGCPLFRRQVIAILFVFPGANDINIRHITFSLLRLGAN
jgi:hypothetical protein